MGSASGAKAWLGTGVHLNGLYFKDLRSPPNHAPPPKKKEVLLGSSVAHGCFAHALLTMYCYACSWDRGRRPGVGGQ